MDRDDKRLLKLWDVAERATDGCGELATVRQALDEIVDHDALCQFVLDRIKQTFGPGIDRIQLNLDQIQSLGDLMASIYCEGFLVGAKYQKEKLTQ